MSIDITIKIGGEAGQGILTVGELLTLVCHRSGLYIMANNEFESRIRGGHSFFQVRISNSPVDAPNHKVNLLVALNRQSYDLHKGELVSGGQIMVEEKGAFDEKDILQISFTELAKKAGGVITSNTVAAGACLALLGAPFDLYKTVLAKLFSSKGEEIVSKNIKAAMLGYEAVSNISFKYRFDWVEDQPKGVITDGAKAIALGALAGDCRLGAFYPMSPATSIMAHLANFTDMLPLVIEQVEGEIAALNMVIGASFAGVRSMTATSGGGFSLMVEGLGLAGITETPVVIVNGQRPGPATGLPTRTAQGDLLFMIRASQDEFPRFVFAPGTPADAYKITARAFHLSEKYQVPVIILVDKYFIDSLYTETESLAVPENVERFIVSDNDIEDVTEYKRYKLTESGISPRALPCMGKTLVVVSGNEHREDGHISESRLDRINMVNKRNSKISHMIKEMKPPKAFNPGAEILLVCWGSTEGAAKEAMDILKHDGIDTGVLVFTDLWPFPVDAVKECMDKGQKFFVVEQNCSAQLGQLIREQTGLTHSGAVLKYDGRPFYPFEIVQGVKEYL